MIVRARYMEPKRHPESGEVHMAWTDAMSTVRVDVDGAIPRDSQAGKAAELAVEKVNATLLGRSVRCSVHCITPYSTGSGNAGNPPDGADAGREPMKGRRGDYAKVAPRANGRFMKAS